MIIDHSYLPVTPNLISPHICRVQVLFVGVKDHSMDCRLLVELGILDVLVKATSWIHVENVQKACVIVERVAVDIVWRLLARKDEYCSGLGIFVVRFGCWVVNSCHLKKPCRCVTHGAHLWAKRHGDKSLWRLVR